MNLFHVRKQYLTFCKAEAAETHNLIGSKIISSVKCSDTRNSLPILDVMCSSHKRHSVSENCKWTLRQTTGVRCTCSERQLTSRRNIDTRWQWSVENIGRNEWLILEMVINDHCQGSVASVQWFTYWGLLVCHWWDILRTVLLSSARKPGAHFFENNKITGVFTMLKLCVSKERLAY